MSRHFSVLVTIVTLILSLFLSLSGCGGGGGGDGEARPDSLLFYGDSSNGTNPVTSGNGLFKIQGGVLQLVKIIAIDEESHVQNFTSLGAKTVFSACGPSGCEPWITDGTTEGTHLIKDINPFGDSNPSAYTLYNDELYFSADDGEYGIELWKTDGTEKGTVMVRNIGIEQDLFPLSPPAPVSGDPHSLKVFKESLFFVANDINYLGYGRGIELWKTDGTEDGTVMVRNIGIEQDLFPLPPTPVNSNPHELTVFNDALFFAANDIDYQGYGRGVELWKTDGSEDGTVMVKNIAVENQDNPATEPDTPVDSFPEQFTIFNNTLYFFAGDGPFAKDGPHGFEPWKTDGTETGTVMVENIGDDSIEPFPATPDNLTYWLTFDGRLFFTADDGETGVEPWSTDGETTTMLADINPYGSSVVPDRGDIFRVYGERLFFFANDGTHGFEPWWTDGTLKGTLLIKDIYSTPINAPTSASELKVLTDYQGQLYFTANDGLTGREIWVTDGTEVGTGILKNIGPDYESGYSGAFGPGMLDGALFFAAFDGRLAGGHGVEMWRTLGTEAETQLMEDLNPGAAYDGVLTASP